MPNHVLLGVNIDHVATVRQARGGCYPEVVHAALAAEEAGADGITLHLREDRRHIQDRDVTLLREVLLTRMNLEMAVTEEMLSIAEKVCPEHVCLVPEKREELTTEGGLDVIGRKKIVQQACDRLASINSDVSLFIDPDIEQVKAAAEVGAPTIEIHTGQYAEAKTADKKSEELARISAAAEQGRALGLVVNAGHGLHYHNVESIARIPEINELNIGHSIIARALFVGIKEAVREMKRLIREA